MEGLYKSKGRFGQAGKEKRKELNRLHSKSKKDELLASRRNMSTDIGSDKRSPFVLGKRKSRTNAKPNDQLQRLQEWQKARAEAKAKALSKKPIFAVRQINKDPFMPKVNITHKSFSTKKAILCMSPKPSRPATVKNTAPPSKPVTFKKSSTKPPPPPPKPTDTKTEEASSKPPRATKKATKDDTKSTRVTVATRHSARLAKKQTVSSASKQVDPVGGSVVAKSTRVTVETRHSPRLAMKQKAVTSANKVSVGGSAVTRSSGAKKASSTKKPARSVTRKAGDENAAPKSVRSGKKRSSPAKSARSNKETVEDVVIPTTPVKKYEPVCPSPLLHCRSASKQQREAVYYGAPLLEDDRAWLPGPLPESRTTDKPDFENVFNDFSPFRFTAGSHTDQEAAPFQFTFQMDPPAVQQLPLTSAPSHSPSINTSLGLGEEDNCVENVSPDVEKTEEDGTSGREKTEEEGGFDTAYFRQLHSTACAKLEQLCAVWEDKAAMFEEDPNGPVTEEVLGQIRTTCCLARLLMRKKLKQYIGLVDVAENDSGERKTTPEDLQGFWDMVYFQVDGLYKAFQELTDMESNGWIAHPPSPKKPKIQKRKSKKVLGSCANSQTDSEASERLQAARKKRAEDRARLRELKAKSSMTGKENQDNMLLV